MSKHRRAHVLLLVENAAVPVDRRVWGEAVTLAAAGYKVSVISPTGEDNRTSSRRESIDGIEIWRFPSRFSGPKKRDFILEYLWAGLACYLLALRVWFKSRFDVVHVANPPDFFFGLKWMFGWRGVSFIFDQHDLAPELYQSKFEQPHKNKLFRLLAWMERRSYQAADAVIVTNESYKRRALALSGKPETELFTVRNSPNSEIFAPRKPQVQLRDGYKNLVVFAGTMGHQDGVEVLLRAARHVRAVRERSEILFVLMGSGDAWDELQKLYRDLDLGDGVRFTGFLGDEEMLNYLATADLGVAPDLSGPLNSVSTMVKTLEYMAMGVPVLSFDLKESRFSAGEAAHYVEDQTAEAFGDAIIDLIDDPDRRSHMSEVGRERINGPLSWKQSTENLLAAYNLVLGEEISGGNND